MQVSLTLHLLGVKDRFMSVRATDLLCVSVLVMTKLELLLDLMNSVIEPGVLRRQKVQSFFGLHLSLKPSI